jgi:hypothetical protein
MSVFNKIFIYLLKFINYVNVFIYMLIYFRLFLILFLEKFDKI